MARLDPNTHLVLYADRAAKKLVGHSMLMPGNRGNEILDKAMTRLGIKERASQVTSEAAAQGVPTVNAKHTGLAVALGERTIDKLKRLGQGARNNLRGLGYTPGSAAATLLHEPVTSHPAGTAHNAIDPGTTAQDTQVTGLYVGPFIFGQAPVSQMVQVPGPDPTPRFQHNGMAAGILENLPQVWRSNINQVIRQDCSGCVETSMYDSGPGHRYGALADFLTTAGFGSVTGPDGKTYAINNFLPKINHDFVGLLAANGQYADNSDQHEPDAPVLAAKHPTTGDAWGVYMYLACVDGTMAWGGPENPVSLLFIWRKIETCADHLPNLDATNVALAIASGGYIPLAELIWTEACYFWQLVKWVVAVIVDVVEAVINEIGTIACDLANTPGLPQALTSAGAMAAAKGGGAYAAGVAAVGVGAEIASTTVCKGAPPVLPPPPPWYTTPLGMMAIGFGALVGIMAISKDKKPALNKTAL